MGPLLYNESAIQDLFQSTLSLLLLDCVLLVLTACPAQLDRPIKEHPPCFTGF